MCPRYEKAVEVGLLGWAKVHWVIRERAEGQRTFADLSPERPRAPGAVGPGLRLCRRDAKPPAATRLTGLAGGERLSRFPLQLVCPIPSYDAFAQKSESGQMQNVDICLAGETAFRGAVGGGGQKPAIVRRKFGAAKS